MVQTGSPSKETQFIPFINESMNRDQLGRPPRWTAQLPLMNAVPRLGVAALWGLQNKLRLQAPRYVIGCQALLVWWCRTAASKLA